MTKILIALLSFLVAAAAPAAGHASIVGKARVIDGDTLEIAGTRLRLEGIDAPESEQKCVIGQQVWHCGRNAEFALSDLVGRHWVACRVVGHDAAGTTLAVCHLAGFEGPEINHEMVKGLGSGRSPDRKQISGCGAFRA